ncbi:MAG: cytidylate kinase-like family protein [Bacteroidia bacterium]|nr:cytidylate kinase-like family protein [Bacteroidia bacterium]
MDNLLLKYMNERIQHATRKIIEPGPVITISREYGCSGNQLAEKLTAEINNKIYDPQGKWRWVNKEILKMASEELNIHQDEVRKIAESVPKSYIDDLAHSFTDKYYVTNDKAKKIIEEVVSNLAIHGKVVIVGRGSEVLSHNIPKSMHIRLFAPMDWKIEAISQRNNCEALEAKKIIVQGDKLRMAFRDSYLKRDDPPFKYDLEFNCARLTQPEIIALILQLAEYRKLIHP